MSAAGPLLSGAVLAMLLAPTLLFGSLVVPALFRHPLAEPGVRLLVRFAFASAFGASGLALLAHVASGPGPQLVSFGAWFSLGEGDFAFDFLVDGEALGFAALSAGVCGVVSAFSYRYLHREPGFTRYFVLLALFALGMTLVALAGSIEVLFAGWELLGLSSALLVAFFHERPAPVDNALRVFAVYRAGDAAMLSAAVLLHHWAGSGSLATLFSGHAAPGHGLDGERTLVIALLLVVAVAGKSALLPFSGWLPRAMEGPTPSSAVYYGALSIHAGCLLLLRAEPLLRQSPVAAFLAALAGAATSIYATATARVQTDVKSALAYASLTQVGIIVVEIALGLTSLAFLHIVGHALFRLLQFLGAPNVLHDLHELEAHGGGVEATDERSSRLAGLADRIHGLALERGLVDALLDRCTVAPLRRLVRALDRLDRRLCGATGDDLRRRGGGMP